MPPSGDHDREHLLAQAAKFYWYHCVELAPGVTTDGDYDMAKILHHYRFPDRMDGLDVLDVGRASGFFAFEFERRGARVVATDINSLADWDWVGGTQTRAERLAAHADEPDFLEEHIHGAFRFAREVRKSEVEARTINVYDLDPQAFGGRTFDFVFAGSIASHLRDPILAFEHLRRVTRGTCVVAAPSVDLPDAAEFPVMCLVGTADPDRRSWWVFNARGLTETLKCGGFTDVEIVSSFRLENRHVDHPVDHLVAHAKP